MRCLCLPSKSKENDTGVLSTSQQKQPKVGFKTGEDDETLKEYIPPAVPSNMYNEENIDVRAKSIAEGGSEVEDTDSQFFFDAREEIDKMSMRGSVTDFKSVASSAAYQDARSAIASTQGDVNAPGMIDDGIEPPQSTESNAGVRLSASVLSKHDGTSARRSSSRKMVNMDVPSSLLQEKQSLRQRSIRRVRRSMSIKRFLGKPRVIVDEKGFPGNLTQSQLDACMAFRSELKERATSSACKDGEVYSEMVASFKEVEEEPYALCRFLRARDFDVKKVFEMMDEHIEVWKIGKQHNFYPDIDEAMGCPLSILLTQYPFLYSGNAKLGFPVCYFHAGNLTVEGIGCITSLDSIPKMMWNTIMYQVPGIMRDAYELDPDFVRCEQITIINLEGLSASQVNSRTIDLVKKGNEIGECVPEILYKCIIINAPSFFAVTWRVIRAFLDPTTAIKFELYSNKKKGQKRLLELIDENSLPSDFGGNGPSTLEILSSKSAKPGEQPPKRRIVELMSVKRGGGEGSLEFDLRANEKIKLQVFTKADLGGSFSIHKYSGTGSSKTKSKTAIAENISVQRTNSNQQSGDGSMNSSFSVSLTDNGELSGEGEYLLVGKSDKKSKNGEHFLVIGDVYG